MSLSLNVHAQVPNTPKCLGFYLLNPCLLPYSVFACSEDSGKTMEMCTHLSHLFLHIPFKSNLDIPLYKIPFQPKGKSLFQWG